MRTAVITTSYPRHPRDAAGHFVETEVRALVRTGHTVTVFAPGRAPEPTFRPNVDEALEPSLVWIADGGAFGWPGALTRLRRRPLRALGATAFAVRAVRALARLGPFDRVVAHFLVPSAWPIAIWGLAPGAALEVVAHGSDARLFARLPRALRRHIADALARRGAHLRCVSRSVQVELARAGLDSRNCRVSVAPCAIDVAGVPERAEARRAFGLHPTAAIVVVVGRLIAGKRIDVALGALSLIPSLHVIVVGDGPERGRLERAFPNAVFAGQRPRNEALSYIAAADALVSASRDEGAPTVVREARALGVPVVALPAGDLLEQAQSDAGILVV